MVYECAALAESTTLTRSDGSVAIDYEAGSIGGRFEYPHP